MVCLVVMGKECRLKEVFKYRELICFCDGCSAIASNNLQTWAEEGVMYTSMPTKRRTLDEMSGSNEVQCSIELDQICKDESNGKACPLSEESSVIESMRMSRVVKNGSNASSAKKGPFNDNFGQLNSRRYCKAKVVSGNGPRRLRELFMGILMHWIFGEISFIELKRWNKGAPMSSCGSESLTTTLSKSGLKKRRKCISNTLSWQKI